LIVRSLAIAAAILAAIPAAAEPPPATVRLMTVDAGPGVIVRRFVGRVEALRTVDLSFQVAGLMTDLPVRTGEVLPKGARIAALDPADFDLARRRAEAQRELAQQEFERARDLTARGAAPVSRRDEALAELRLAEVDFDSAIRDVGLTEITAPFEALVTRRLVDAFTYVTPETPVVRVQDVSELRVVISVPEDLIAARADPDSFTATARLAALPGAPIPLTLREFVTEADAVAQTYEVSFAIDAPRDSQILPGMTATVEIRTNGEAAGRAPVLPLTALDPNGETGFQVWVYDAGDGTVAPLPVELGLPDAESAPVLSGLRGGETIVAAGVDRLRPGMRVRPLDL
jgi:RND family efflux transporter MFP subunit